MHRSFVTDLDDCQRLWNTFLPARNVFDLWEVRLCFQRHFHSTPCFMILQDGEGIAALLPLSYLQDLDMYVFFPGETWQGKTWLERTPIYLREGKFFPELLERCPDRTYLRYMELANGDAQFELPAHLSLDVDEIGYVLYPSGFDFDSALYRRRFSTKRLKDIDKTIGYLTQRDVSFHFNRMDDFEFMVDMSLTRYGESSYMYDDRFRASIRDLVHLLYHKGWLRMVSLEIEEETAAVDLGALYEGVYTVFLGGTHPEFQGVAKVMNMHHIEFACTEALSKIDFLCGDFHWKKLWHLDPEPLCKFVSPSLESEDQTDVSLTLYTPSTLMLQEQTGA